jgi:hypothetical protein
MFKPKKGGGKIMKIPLMKILASYLALVMFIIGITPRVYAGFVASEVLTLKQTDRTSDLQKIQKVIEMKIVQERLKKFGFTHDEILERLARLNDGQIHYLAQNIDQLQTGGNGLEVVILLLVIAILVVLLIKLTGHKVIIK